MARWSFIASCSLLRSPQIIGRSLPQTCPWYFLLLHLLSIFSSQFIAHLHNFAICILHFALTAVMMSHGTQIIARYHGHGPSFFMSRHIIFPFIFPSCL